MGTLEDNVEKALETGISIGDPLENLEGGSYTGDVEKWKKEGSRNGAYLSEGGQWGGNWRGVPLLVTPKIC